MGQVIDKINKWRKETSPQDKALQTMMLLFIDFVLSVPAAAPTGPSLALTMIMLPLTILTIVGAVYGLYLLLVWIYT